MKNIAITHTDMDMAQWINGNTFLANVLLRMMVAEFFVSMRFRDVLDTYAVMSIMTTERAFRMRGIYPTI